MSISNKGFSVNYFCYDVGPMQKEGNRHNPSLLRILHLSKWSRAFEQILFVPFFTERFMIFLEYHVIHPCSVSQWSKSIMRILVPPFPAPFETCGILETEGEVPEGGSLKTFAFLTKKRQAAGSRFHHLFWLKCWLAVTILILWPDMTSRVEKSTCQRRWSRKIKK